jgi:hypothetical protein
VNEEDAPAALAGTVGTLRMLADGSISVSLVFEPKDRMAVMTMMGSPGTPVACARLPDGFARASDKPAKASWKDLGPLCREAIDLCANTRFQEYIARPALGKKWKPTEEAAKGFILSQCGVDSRKDLDKVEGARDLFIEHVRKPFLQWQHKQYP